MNTILARVLISLAAGWVLLHPCFISAEAAELSPRLAETLKQGAPGTPVPVIVRLAEPSSVRTLAVPPAARGAVRARARSALVRALKERAASSQKPIRDLLRQRGLPEPKDLWLINGLAFNASPDLIEELAQRPEIEAIAFDEVIQLPRVVKAADSDLNGVEDNIDVVQAPSLWNAGIIGQGVTVAIVDSGVDVLHEDLAPGWRGGTNSWFNAVAENCSNTQVTCATSCDTETTQPCDYLDAQDVAHGTGVAGVLVGGDATGTAIGVAPGAKWIAAKIFDSNDNAPASLIHQAFAWLLDPDGDPATDDAPDVVNNSWGFEQSSASCITDFQADIQMLKDAGIAVVFSAGNTGPASDTSISPANNANGFAVGSVGTGATGSLDYNQVSSFSARGPSACDDTIYPEIVSPGHLVKTADTTLGGAFPIASQIISGTSFSAPHAAGVMALLLSAFPDTTVAELETALMESAVDLGTAGPDNDYGYGRVDALAAFNYLNGEPNIEVTDSSPPPTDGLLEFGHIPPGSAANETVQVRNVGSANLSLGSAGGISAPFVVTNDTCSNVALPPGQSCTLTISFSPAALGTFSDSLTILSNDPDQPEVPVVLNGVGNTPPVAPQPVAPADGAVVGSTVTFSWLPASDADGDGVSQTLVVSPHVDFTAAATIPVDPVAPLALGAAGLLAGALVFRRRRRLALPLLAAGLLLGLLACGGGGGGGGSSPQEEAQSLTRSGFISGATYYWKMQAEDSRGAVTESVVRSFRVEG